MYCLYTLAIWYCLMEVIPWENEEFGLEETFVWTMALHTIVIPVCPSSD